MKNMKIMLLDWMMKEDYSKLKGESWTLWGLAPLDVWTCLGRQRTKRKKIMCVC